MDGLSSNSFLMMQRSMEFLWSKQSCILDNIANVETPGYQVKYATFEEALKNAVLSSAQNGISSSSIRKAIEETPVVVREAQESMAGGVSLSCMYITWETYQCGNVLSLIVSCGWGFDMNTHSVYLYDTATGEQMTTAQLLETLQVEPETFLAAVRQAAAERFDGKYAGIGGDTDELVAERRAWTLSDENINLDVMTYADAAGNLYVYLPIGSIAGAASYEEPLTLDLGAAG